MTICGKAISCHPVCKEPFTGSAAVGSLAQNIPVNALVCLLADLHFSILKKLK